MEPNPMMNAFRRNRLFHPKSVGEWGQTMAFMVITLPAFVGAMGLAVDVGNFYYNYYRLQSAVDTAALVGAKCLASTNPSSIAASAPGCNGTCGTGSTSPCTPSQTATYYATTLNGVLAGEVIAPTSPGAYEIAIGATRSVPYYFARLVGTNTGTVSVSATAQSGPLGTTSSSGNAIPLGLQACEPSISVCKTPYNLGDTLTFAAKKNEGGAWISGSGDWSALSIPASISVCAPPAGTCISSDPGFAKIKHIIDDIINDPSTGLIARGNSVDPTGTALSHAANNPRVVTVPLVDWSLGGAGCNGACNMNVYGFAEIWINSATNGGPNGSSVNATFIRQVATGQIDKTGTASDVGATAIKLIL
jgi:Flp pilus assembly protein TadG